MHGVRIPPSTRRVSTGTAPFDVEPHDEAEAWHLAVRVATATSGVGAAVAVALTHLAGLSATPVVAALAVAGLAVGLRLPPAWPRRYAARSVLAPTID